MAADGTPSAPWYRDGLRFRCTACGHCCTGVPGHVWVTEEEVERMARFKGLSTQRFMRENVRRVGQRLSLVERKNGDCVLLKDSKCSVYPVKPVPCSTFPFWEGPLANKESWKETAVSCEGIGQGDLYPLAEVERIQAGDPTPLLERHAAAVAAASATTSGYGRESSTQPPPAASASSTQPPPAASASSTQPPPAVDSPSPAQLSAALADLEALYAELDKELPRHRMTCVASGDCCDFDRFGHRLYASTLEAEWFFRNSPDPRVNANDRHCPAWGADRLCKARVGRMLGCRTFHCGPYPGSRPEDVHEPYHARIKALHERHGIPYAYRDVLDWSKERRPVAPPAP